MLHHLDRDWETTLKKGDVIKFKNGGRIHIIGPKGDGYDYQDGSEKGHHPKKWFDMMISTGKAMVVEDKAAFTKSSKFDIMNEEFKVGDEVTYLGHPGKITLVDKDSKDKVYYSVSYDKGTGKTKATNIYNKDSEIKAVKEGTCGYGPNGVPGKTPGGTRGMSGDDRTRTMLKMLIKKEIAKLS